VVKGKVWAEARAAAWAIEAQVAAVGVVVAVVDGAAIAESLS